MASLVSFGVRWPARPAGIAHRTGLGDALQNALADLKGTGLLTSHQAAEVFKDGRTGVVLRIRRPGVVLTVEAAGPLWLKDSWSATGPGDCPDAA